MCILFSFFGSWHNCLFGEHVNLLRSSVSLLSNCPRMLVLPIFEFSSKDPPRLPIQFTLTMSRSNSTVMYPLLPPHAEATPFKTAQPHHPITAGGELPRTFIYPFRVAQYGAVKSADQGNYVYRIPATQVPQGYFFTDVLVPVGASTFYLTYYSRYTQPPTT